MTRDDLEAVIWRNWPTRGSESFRSVHVILAAADAYATHYKRHRRHLRRERRILYHASSTDLYPLVGALASALLDEGQGLEWDGQPPGEARREMADSAGRDPWAGAA